jgi:hypothetical protein
MAGEMHGAFSSMAAVWTSAADVGHDNSGPPSRAAHKMADITVCFINMHPFKTMIVFLSSSYGTNLIFMPFFF